MANNAGDRGIRPGTIIAPCLPRRGCGGAALVAEEAKRESEADEESALYHRPIVAAAIARFGTVQSE